MSADMSPEEFNRRFGPELAGQPTIDPHPYGPPTQPNPAHNPQAAPVKTGLTPRGKAAVAIAVTVMAGGGLLGWQHYASEASANNVKAQELALQQQKLQLEQLKEQNRQAAELEKKESADEQAAQKQINACIDANKDLIGKRIGSTYQSVTSDCQAQYGSSDGDGMQEAAAAHNSGGGVSNFLLVGGGVLALGLGIAVRRATRPSPPPPPYYAH